MDIIHVSWGLKSPRSSVHAFTMILARIGIAAKQLDACTRTLRRGDTPGKISCTRTAGGHRRFSIVEIRGLQEDPSRGTDMNAPIEGKVAVYCRVSSHEQKAKGNPRPSGRGEFNNNKEIFLLKLRRDEYSNQ
jgi:hypothetical protein